MGNFIPVEPEKWAEMVKALAENARLKAEVEELTHDANEADQQYEHAISRVRRLEAEVERLIYVGDMLATMASHCEVTGDAHRLMLELSAEWNSAKEGKQS